jgi:hypothetical protein
VYLVIIRFILWKALFQPYVRDYSLLVPSGGNSLILVTSRWRSRCWLPMLVRELPGFTNYLQSLSQLEELLAGLSAASPGMNTHIVSLGQWWNK